MKRNPFSEEKSKDYRNELFNTIKSLEAIDSVGKNDENIETTEYDEVDGYCEEEFEEAESGGDNYEDNKIEVNEDFEDEEYEYKGEHGFEEEKNGDNFDEEDDNSIDKKKKI